MLRLDRRWRFPRHAHGEDGEDHQGHADEPQQNLYPVSHIHSPFRPSPTKASVADLFAPLFTKILAS